VIRRLVLAASLLCVLLPGTPATSQNAPPAISDTVLNRKVRDIASMLRCPVCLNLSIQDSPSELAHDMREVVREQLAQGKTEQEVLNYFIQRYGEWVLMRPPAHGISLLVWLLPAVMIIGGGALVVFAVQRWVRNSRPAETTAADVSEEEVREVREQLARQQARGQLD
jgi:cytochrome c-type biogenesis protein CcmH